jgi:diguanylate cyclase (GGDEF)-like protein
MFMWAVLLLASGYIYIIYRVTKAVSKRQKGKLKQELIETENKFEEILQNKESLRKQVQLLDREANQIFVLYELTKEINKNFNEEEAFKTFKNKLAENVSFEDCLLIKPDSTQLKDLEADKSYAIFPLKERRQILGYLAVRNVSEPDMVKVMILGHQLTLALQRIHLYREVEKLAMIDSLTGVATRRQILERLNEEISRSQAKKINVSLLMIDVDYFKRFNDKYGHLTGDKILSEIGRLLKENVREIDIVGRYGGEEFSVVLPDTNAQGAHYVAERIRTSIESSVINAYDTNIKATVSIGVATFPDHGKTPAELLEKSDKALYHAKGAGRNRTCIFNDHAA